MDISSIRLHPLPLTGTEARARLAWQAGEILIATVVVSRAEELTLEIGGTRVHAQSGLQFSPGQHLRLQVIEPGELPVLRRLDDIRDTNIMVQGRALCMALPQQEPLAPVFAELARFVQYSAARVNRTSRSTLSSIAAEIFTHLPQINDLIDPEGLKQAILESGLFLEARLANLPSKTTPSPDLKADLLRLAAAAEEAVRDEDVTVELGASFQHAVHGALARLEVNQINWLGGGILSVELPIRREQDGTDILTLVLEKGEKMPDGYGGALRPWTATLRFNFDGLGIGAYLGQGGGGK